MLKKTLSIALVSTGLALLAVTPANAVTYPSDTLALLAAGERTAVLTETTGNTTTLNNGSEWYLWADHSIGFANVGTTVDLSSADITFGDTDWARLSWHLEVNEGLDFINGGYRLGDNTDLNFQNIDEEFTEEEYLAQESLSTGRYIFTADVQPDFYPVGPQEDVPLSDLDGWTLCWSNLYADEDPSTAALVDIWAACDGAYLMLAGGAIGTGVEDPGPGADELATTGADSGWILGSALAFLAIGMIVAVRRQKA